MVLGVFHRGKRATIENPEIRTIQSLNKDYLSSQAVTKTTPQTTPNSTALKVLQRGRTTPQTIPKLQFFQFYSHQLVN